MQLSECFFPLIFGPLLLYVFLFSHCSSLNHHVHYYQQCTTSRTTNTALKPMVHVHPRGVKQEEKQNHFT